MARTDWITGEPLSERLTVAVKAEIETLEKKIEAVRTVNECVEDAERAILDLNFPSHFSWENGKNSAGVTIHSSFMLFVTIGVHIKRVGDVAPIIRRLRRMGYERDSMQEDALCNAVRWYFKRDGIPCQLQLFASLPPKHADGAICRYVEVGKKEEPVYELRCDGEPTNIETIGQEVG